MSIAPDEKTPTKPLPAPHVESGPEQFRSALRNLLREELAPVRNEQLRQDAVQKLQGRALAGIAAARVVLPTIGVVLALLALGAIVSLHARPAQALTRCAPGAPEPAGGR